MYSLELIFFMVHVGSNLDSFVSVGLCFWHKNLYGLKECSMIKTGNWPFLRTICSHNETFECGICDYKTETYEQLEKHLFTFEIFQCRYCDFSDKNISDFFLKPSETT